MTSAVLASSANPEKQVRVDFSMKVDCHLNRHPVTGASAGTKTDLELKVQSVDGKPLPDGDYELRPEGTKDMIRVRKSANLWTPLSINFG